MNIIWIDLNEELYQFILGKVKDEQTSKDIHQEVFLKVQTKLHQLKHISKLTSWVYQITRNSIIDYYRKTKDENISIFFSKDIISVFLQFYQLMYTEFYFYAKTFYKDAL